MIERIAARFPSLHSSVARVYGDDAYLFGIDFARSDWAMLCDEAEVHEYERSEPLFWDGLRLQQNSTLKAGQINAVVFVLNQLIIRLTSLAVPAAAYPRIRKKSGQMWSCNPGNSGRVGHERWWDYRPTPYSGSQL